MFKMNLIFHKFNSSILQCVIIQHEVNITKLLISFIDICRALTYGLYLNASDGNRSESITVAFLFSKN